MKFLEVLVNFLITWITFAILVVIYYFTWAGVINGLEVGFGIHPVISFIVTVVLLQVLPGPSGFVFTILGVFLTQKYLNWPVWQTCLIYLPTTIMSIIMVLLSFLISIWTTFLEINKHIRKS